MSSNLPSSLQYLNINNATLIGGTFQNITFNNFPNLQSLVISNTRISGTIPSHIGLLNQLRDLTLSYSQIRGSLPILLANLVYV